MSERMAALPELVEVRERRKRLGLTQQELARRARVSQSLVAKVEAGRVDPSYGVAKRLFEALESVGRTREASAGEVMRTRLLSVGPADTLRAAVAKLRRHEISQMPVLARGAPVGTVTEAVLLDALTRMPPGTPVRAVMAEAPPLVAPETSARAVASLLRHYLLVLVAREGRIKGLITRADLLEKLP
jgi:predicted transcriptional regulator